MENFKAFSKEELENKNTYQLCSKKVEDGLTFGYGGIGGDEISKLVTLRIKLKESLRALKGVLSSELYEKYYILLIRLNFFTLEDLGKNEIIDLFKKNTIFAFRDELILINLEDKIRQTIFSEPNIQKRDILLTSIRKALKESVEKLGNKRIQLRSSNEPEDPTLKNWLTDYGYVVGAGEHGELDISNYLFKSKNVKILNSEEKEILKKILMFYEKLKFNMTDPNSFSVYSLSMFNIREVGKGLDKKYLPEDPEEYMAEIEKRKKAREEKRKIVRGELSPENLIGQRSDLISRRTQVQNVPSQEQNLPPAQAELQSSEQEAPRKKSDFEKKKEEKFSKLTAIPKVSLAKLSAAPSLQKLTVEDFRSYGSDAQSRGAYISAKIRKLLENSPENKEAIKHYLRKSELYKVYLSQGKESLDSKKDIAEIAHNRESKGEKYLEKEEFGVLKNVLKSI